jgi:biotin-(acetyl-CoA carboxylase) ligase
MSQMPSFPPLLSGAPVAGAADPFVAAQEQAAEGCDGGTILHNLQADRLRAAIVFAPEVPLAEAMTMLPVCGVAFQNAFGALAPPEVAVHLTWDGQIRVNGARCGGLRVAAAPSDPRSVPDWLVIGLDLAILPTSDLAPGETPDQTALYEEGCGDIDPVHLLESWARHTLLWVNRWTDAGAGAIHDDWLALVQGLGAAIEVDGRHGTFLGVDAQFGLLLREADGTSLIPLTHLLETRT